MCIVDFSPSQPNCITHVQYGGDLIAVWSSVFLGPYMISSPRSKIKEMRRTGHAAFLLVIENVKYAAVVNESTHQYAYLEPIKKLRCYMHVFQYARKYRIPISCEVYAKGPKNSEIWTCRLLMGDRYYMGIGLAKQDAKDEAALRALLAFGVDLRGLS